MSALTDSGAFWVALIALAAALYLLPTLIGLVRGVDGLALVFLVNLIGGTALIGWPAAMILAFGPRRPDREERRASYPFVVREPERFWVPRPPDPKAGARRW
jgi:hypothetical protein